MSVSDVHQPQDSQRSPLAAVLAAFQDGAVSTAEVRLRTGLDEQVVAAAVDHLVRMGRLERAVVDLGCSSDQCGNCPGAACGSGCHHDASSGHEATKADGQRPGGTSYDGHDPDRDPEVLHSRRLSGLHLRGGPGQRTQSATRPE